MPRRTFPDTTPEEDRGPDSTLRLRRYLPVADSIWFSVGCAPCDRVRPISVHAAIELMGTEEASLGELARRLRCSDCGGKRVDIVITPDTRSAETIRREGLLSQTRAGLGPEE